LVVRVGVRYQRPIIDSESFGSSPDRVGLAVSLPGVRCARELGL